MFLLPICQNEFNTPIPYLNWISAICICIHEYCICQSIQIELQIKLRSVHWISVTTSKSLNLKLFLLRHNVDAIKCIDFLKFWLWPLEEPLQHMNATARLVTESEKLLTVAGKLFAVTLKWNPCNHLSAINGSVITSYPQSGGFSEVPLHIFNIKLYIHFYGIKVKLNAHAHMFILCLQVTHIAAVWLFSRLLLQLVIEITVARETL